MVQFPATRFLAPLGMTGALGMTGIGGMTGVGVQMRTKRMGNGGPTMRGRAKLKGAA
jgi:hypothetical protein